MTKEIKGIGNDIIEIERIRRSINRNGESFIKRLFTEKEQEYCAQFKDSSQNFAGRFAAKEAIAKALGIGFGRDLSFQDIEILGNDKGKPIVHFSEKATKYFQKPNILLSISHSDHYATAVAIWFD